MTTWTSTRGPDIIDDESRHDHDHDHGPTSRARPGRMVGLVVAAAFALAVVALIVQNTQTSHVSWFWLDTNVSQWVLLAAAFVAGLVVGPLTLAGIRFSRHRHD